MVTSLSTFFRSGTSIRSDSVKTMIKGLQGRQCGSKTCLEGQNGAPFRLTRPPIHRQHSPEPDSTTSPLLWPGQSPERSCEGPFLPLSTVTYLAMFRAEPSFPPCRLCPGLQIKDAAFHSLFNLSRKCLVTDPATWHPLSHCGNGMLTKKVIFQPSWKQQELELTC